MTETSPTYHAHPLGWDPAKDLDAPRQPFVAFTVEGNPIPKGRPRVMLRPGRRATAYTPATTKLWEAQVATAARLAMGGMDPAVGPVSLVLWFYRENRVRCDGDNIEKAASDSMSGIVWVDDYQVVDCEWHLRHDPARPRVEVTVWSVDEGEL